MGTFVINKTKTGYTFVRKAGNGEVIATGGEVFSTLDSGKNSIASVRKNAPLASLEDQTMASHKALKVQGRDRNRTGPFFTGR